MFYNVSSGGLSEKVDATCCKEAAEKFFHNHQNDLAAIILVKEAKRAAPMHFFSTSEFIQNIPEFKLVTG
jgi:hypothetical protein